MKIESDPFSSHWNDILCKSQMKVASRLGSLQIQAHRDDSFHTTLPDVRDEFSLNPRISPTEIAVEQPQNALH
jgi:hypothetical protein